MPKTKPKKNHNSVKSEIEKKFSWFYDWIAICSENELIVWGKNYSFEDVKISRVVGPFVQIECGPLSVILLIERLKNETKFDHVDPLKRLMQLHAQYPHRWCQLVPQLQFEKKHYPENEYMKQIELLPESELSTERKKEIGSFHES